MRGRIHLLATNFSRTLESKGSREIGRKSEGEDGEEHLGIGETFADLKQLGTCPTLSDQLNKKVTEGARISARSRKGHEGRPSGPGDLFFSLHYIVQTSLQDREIGTEGSSSIETCSSSFTF